MALYSADHEVLSTAREWLYDRHQAVLVTVAKTWGSSPRPVGSLMVMREDGVHVGSVSGGCVEEDLLTRLRSDQIAAFPCVVNYGVTRDQANRLGLPCGGRLELLLERMQDPKAVTHLLDKLSRGELIARRVHVETGRVQLLPASPEDDFSYDNAYLQKVFGPRWSMLLIGAGHLSRFVAQIALALDYRVTVCDPRMEYQESWNVEGAQLVRDMPDDAVRSRVTHSRSVVVTLTHDPKLDDMALMEALCSPAYYVGALGSVRSSKKRLERLRALGVSETQLARLHGPVGLPIGSRTPAEIAVSILAEITAKRRGATPQSSTEARVAQWMPS